jgi:hypothetical protein
MTSIAFNSLAVNNAEQFKESVSEPTPNTRIFLTYGYIEPWSNDNTPPLPNTSVSSVYEIWNKMVGGKRVTGENIRHVIQRNDWVSGTVYSAYDDRNIDLFNENNRFYILTDDYHVYKCISNANGAVSTSSPTYVSSGMGSKLADGYIWKYMYSISASEQLNYLTNEYMPVKTLSADDGTIQWDVQQDAVDGAIHSIVITNPGSNYSNEANLIVTLSGDGSSFSAYANISSTGAVSNVTINDPGSGYTFATVAITGGGGTGATGRAIIPPTGGHGKDATYELGGSRLIISVKVRGSEEGVLPTTNDIRQIALIKDPYLLDTSIVASNSAFFQGQTITVTGSGDFIQDEFVYQGASLATSTYSARVLSWDSATNALKVVDINGGLPSGGASLTGAISSTTRFIVSIDDKDFQPLSGQVLYMDNIKPITRAADQTENYKIVLKF